MNVSGLVGKDRRGEDLATKPDVDTLVTAGRNDSNRWIRWTLRKTTLAMKTG